VKQAGFGVILDFPPRVQRGCAQSLGFTILNSDIAEGIEHVQQAIWGREKAGLESAEGTAACSDALDAPSEHRDEELNTVGTR